MVVQMLVRSAFNQQMLVRSAFNHTAEDKTIHVRPAIVAGIVKSTSVDGTGYVQFTQRFAGLEQVYMYDAELDYIVSVLNCEGKL